MDQPSAALCPKTKELNNCNTINVNESLTIYHAIKFYSHTSKQKKELWRLLGKCLNMHDFEFTTSLNNEPVIASFTSLQVKGKEAEGLTVDCLRSFCSKMMITKCGRMSKIQLMEQMYALYIKTKGECRRGVHNIEGRPVDANLDKVDSDYDHESVDKENKDCEDMYYSDYDDDNIKDEYDSDEYNINTNSVEISGYTIEELIIPGDEYYRFNDRHDMEEGFHWDCVDDNDEIQSVTQSIYEHEKKLHLHSQSETQSTSQYLKCVTEKEETLSKLLKLYEHHKSCSGECQSRLSTLFELRQFHEKRAHDIQLQLSKLQKTTI